MPASAPDLLADYLARHAATLLELAGSLDEDAVHDSRTSARRIRATLRTFRPLLQREAAEQLRAELRGYAAGLGELRDLTEGGGVLLQEVLALPRDQRAGPVTTRVRRELRSREQAVTRRLRAGPGMPSALRDRLAGWAEAVPWREHADVTVEVMVERVRWARRRVKRAARAVEALDPAAGLAERGAAWHEVRKKAKAVRFGCEVLEPALGRPARRGEKAWHDLSDVLGEAQDLWVARELLQGCAEAARTAGEDPFSYGVLDERLRAGLEHRLAAARPALETALRRTPKGR